MAKPRAPSSKAACKSYPPDAARKQQALACHHRKSNACAPSASTSAENRLIARQWKYLEPLRAGCESLGPPVSTADEDAPPLWPAALNPSRCSAQAHGALIKAELLSQWCAARAHDGWFTQPQRRHRRLCRRVPGRRSRTTLVHPLVTNGAKPAATGTAPLLTAHRAKGLELTTSSC